jgi:SecD/SecF fusion protein
MSPGLTFTYGLIVLLLFVWYFATDHERNKRFLGSALTVLVCALCLIYIYPPKEKIQLGLDLKGGTSFLIQLYSNPDEAGERSPITRDKVDQAVEVIRKRVDDFGTGEPVITPSGADRILVQIPGLAPEKLASTREQLQKVAKLEFRLVHPNNEQILQGFAPPDPAYMRAKEKITRGEKVVEGELVVRKKPDLTGNMVSRAAAIYGPKGWEVMLGFTSEGGKVFGELTQQHVNERFAIMLDGEVISAPNINEPILGGSASISGTFTEPEARNLASVLENPLQTPVRIQEERSTSPSLGADSIKSGIYSGLWGMALICLAVLAYYRLAGFVALIALAVEALLLFGLLAMFGAVLTLPGIAGTILTLGMAIDANVLIYERLREEIAAGKPLKIALDAAYNKAFSAIFDSHVTTLVTAAILYWQATGPVRGFAVTLTIGIIVSLFTALVITRNLFSWMFQLNLLKKISMANLISATEIDFIGKRRTAMILSGIAIVVLAAVFAIRGGSNFGVDFRGGDRLVIEAQGQKVSEDRIRKALDDLKIGDSVVQLEKSAVSEFVTIRTPMDKGAQALEHLLKTFPEAKYRVEGTEKVGSVVGRELIRSSLLALALGLLGILVYVAVQFEFSFAVGALVALLHDLLITIGLFSLAGREISLIFVGSILTVAGYSVNDKIVIFDRIREGIRAGRVGSIPEIMNRSINETLSRTILTGGTTLLALAALYFFGGPVLNDFAFSIFIGVVVGTFSSVYIAAPIVLWWSGKGGQALRSEVKLREQEAVAARAATQAGAGR